MSSDKKKTNEIQKKKGNGSVFSIFMHADTFDIILMTLEFIGAIGDGVSMPVMLIVTSQLMNNIGNSDFVTMAKFTDGINKNSVVLCYMACGIWMACFLEGYCWARTAERQASRSRARYLKAILRQEVGYFDLHVTSTAEVIASVSNDSIVIQEVISEKVPTFLMNVTAFIGAYIVPALC